MFNIHDNVIITKGLYKGSNARVVEVNQHDYKVIQTDPNTCGEYMRVHHNNMTINNTNKMNLSIGTKTNKGIIQKVETIYTINNKQYKEHELTIDPSDTEEQQLKLLKDEIDRLTKIKMENTDRTNLIIQYAETLNRINAVGIQCVSEDGKTYIYYDNIQGLIAEYSIPIY